MRTEFSITQKKLAIQRLTALWAFAESGLGGMLHAFHIPVTGLVLGSISVICISLIASFAGRNRLSILKSLLIVLIVKAVVSPQTPFPAYIAVAFQALCGYCFFSVGGLNFVTIIFVAVISMLESALQKLLLVTMVFGKSLWTGIDELVKHIAKPIGLETNSGSSFLIGCYLFVYLAGGLLTAVVSYKLVKQSFHPAMHCELDIIPENHVRVRKKKWKLIFILAGLGVLIFSGLYSGRGSTILQPLIWTVMVICAWYFLIVPRITLLLQRILMRTGSKYQEEAFEIISFFPFIRKIAHFSWIATADKTPFTRIPAFLVLLISSLLSFQSPQFQDQA